LSRRSTAAGSPALASETLGLKVGARSATSIALPASVADAGDPATEYVEVRAADGSTAYWYFVEDTALQLVAPAEAFAVETSATPDGYDVTVTAHALVKDLALFPDRLAPAARVDSGLITLAAEESHTFHVTGAPAPSGPLGVPVLRSVNDLLN
jgi:beta-mannosidase